MVKNYFYQLSKKVNLKEFNFCLDNFLKLQIKQIKDKKEKSITVQNNVINENEGARKTNLSGRQTPPRSKLIYIYLLLYV